jgi:chromosome segregation ATPase
LEKLGAQAGIAVAQFGEIRGSLDLVAVELGKVEGVLKGITDVNTTDVKAPINRLVEALDVSAVKTTASTERLETLKGELEGVRAASQDLAKAMGSEVAKPLADHRQAVERAQQQVARVQEEMGRVAKQLEAVVNGRQPGEQLLAQLLARLGELQADLKETNGQIKAVVQRVDGSPVHESRPGFFSFLRGGR